MLALVLARVATRARVSDRRAVRPRRADADGAGGIAFDGAPRWFGSHVRGLPHRTRPAASGCASKRITPSCSPTAGSRSSSITCASCSRTTWAAAQCDREPATTAGSTRCRIKPCDENGFALEMDDASGKPVGKFAAVVGNACVTRARRRPTSTCACSTTAPRSRTRARTWARPQWDLCWTAPAAGAGVITAYLAAVDGNGGDGTRDVSRTTRSVTTSPRARSRWPKPVAPRRRRPAAVDARRRRGAASLVALVLVARGRRRRRRSRSCSRSPRSAAASHVRPRQRETLAKRNMKFAPDPTEDELDLHMQESREGSSGGYGSSGGGCGCN